MYTPLACISQPPALAAALRLLLCLRRSTGHGWRWSDCTPRAPPGSACCTASRARQVSLLASLHARHPAASILACLKTPPETAAAQLVLLPAAPVQRCCCYEWSKPSRRRRRRACARFRCALRSGSASRTASQMPLLVLPALPLLWQPFPRFVCSNAGCVSGQAARPAGWSYYSIAAAGMPLLRRLQRYASAAACLPPQAAEEALEPTSLAGVKYEEAYRLQEVRLCCCTSDGYRAAWTITPARSPPAPCLERSLEQWNEPPTARPLSPSRPCLLRSKPTSWRSRPSRRRRRCCRWCSRRWAQSRAGGGASCAAARELPVERWGLPLCMQPTSCQLATPTVLAGQARRGHNAGVCAAVQAGAAAGGGGCRGAGQAAGAGGAGGRYLTAAPNRATPLGLAG